MIQSVYLLQVGSSNYSALPLLSVAIVPQCVPWLLSFVYASLPLLATSWPSLAGCECATITCVYQRRGQNVAAQALLAGQWREAGPSVVNTCLLKVTMYRGASTNLRGVILGSVSHVQNTFVYIDTNHFL